MTSSARRMPPWLPVVGVIAVWLVVVGREVPYFYGEFGDDLGVFLGGLATVADWRQAFSGWHVNALYFLAISYLPLKLHLALPGAVLPDFSHENIALYRGLIAYTVLLHAVILGFYARFVYQLTRRHLVTLLATLLLATNPFFLSMATTPDSRIIGLLFALPGMTLAFTLDWSTARLTRGTLLQALRRRRFAHDELPGALFRPLSNRALRRLLLDDLAASQRAARHRNPRGRGLWRGAAHAATARRERWVFPVAHFRIRSPISPS